MTKNNEEMTDKQIIIDGVDVGECKYFNKYQKIVRNNECIVDIQNACIEEMKTKPCSQKHNCYFKNWQRKKQECGQLREAMHKDFCTHYALGECSQNHHDNCVGRNQCIKDLEQECGQLKAELELFKTSNQTTIDQLKAENEKLKKQLESTKGLVTIGNRQLMEALKKNEELTSKCSQLEGFPRKIRNIILEFAKGDILTFPDLSLEKNCIAIQNQCLDPIRQIIQKLDEMQDENCHFEKIKELTKEM